MLCALCSSERLPQFSLKITVQVLYDRYVLASSQERDIIPLSYVDYMDVVSALESHGVLSLNGVCGRKGLEARTYADPREAVVQDPAS